MNVFDDADEGETKSAVVVAVADSLLWSTRVQ